MYVFALWQTEEETDKLSLAQKLETGGRIATLAHM